jgi:hypothetical protein
MAAIVEVEEERAGVGVVGEWAFGGEVGGVGSDEIDDVGQCARGEHALGHVGAPAGHGLEFGCVFGSVDVFDERGEAFEEPDGVSLTQARGESPVQGVEELVAE